ncbi:MAG: radical SAM protein [Bacteroidetes bacterium]|nr:radical SAM protein [Bacteroidota bacterium]
MKNFIYSKSLNTISKIKGNPFYLILFVNDKCPNNCLHCWYNNEWKRDNIVGKNLSYDELKKISESINKLEFLTLTGGEAFLRDDIEDIAEVFVKNTKTRRLDITTSGFDSELISKRIINILNKINGTPFRVDVSLDGLEETHNLIRQNKNAFRNAVSTIQSLNDIKKQYSNFDSSIITTISKYNINEVDKLSEYIDEIMPEGEWMVNIVRSNTPAPIATKDEITAYKKAHEYIDARHKLSPGDVGHKLGKWLTAKNSLRREIIIDTVENGKNHLNCAAGSLSGVIFNDGDVRACETLTDSLGNIKDFNYDLKKVWNNNKAKELRRKIQYTNCSCTHECYLSVSILIQPICVMKLIMKRLTL